MSAQVVQPAVPPVVLVVAETADRLPACLSAAAEAARALPGARIEALHVRIDPAATIEPSEEVMTARYRQEIELREAAEGTAVRTAFDAWRAATPGAAACWREVQAVPAEAVREQGRRAALVVLGTRSDGAHPARAEGFHAALFDTGRPVLIVPPATVQQGKTGPFGHHLAVGWRDVPATRRSLAALRPWLLAAERVSLIEVGGAETPVPADWAAANLPAGAALHHVPGDGRDAGAALLAEAARLGADGLAMGAYRRGRMVEWMLGGVTDHVLAAATIPVLLNA